MYCDGDLADVYIRTWRTARKAHKCSACAEQIRPRDRYTHTAIVGDGTAWTVKRCARCEAIHAHLRERANQSYGEWPSDELDCGESYEDVFCEDPPPEIAALAFALPGET